MTLEEENAQLRAENAELRTLATQLQEQLAAVQGMRHTARWRLAPPRAIMLSGTFPAGRARPLRRLGFGKGRRALLVFEGRDLLEDRCPDCAYRLRGHSIA